MQRWRAELQMSSAHCSLGSTRGSGEQCRRAAAGSAGHAVARCAPRVALAVRPLVTGNHKVPLSDLQRVARVVALRGKVGEGEGGREGGEGKDRHECWRVRRHKRPAGGGHAASWPLLSPPQPPPACTIPLTCHTPPTCCDFSNTVTSKPADRARGRSVGRPWTTLAWPPRACTPPLARRRHRPSPGGETVASPACRSWCAACRPATPAPSTAKVRGAMAADAGAREGALGPGALAVGGGCAARGSSGCSAALGSITRSQLALCRHGFRPHGRVACAGEREVPAEK